VEGPVVHQIQQCFREDWFFATEENLTGEVWFPDIHPMGITLARGIADGPDEDFEKCKLTILSALSHAQSSVQIVTPYFIPDATLITALNLAAMSGVSVDIVLPEKNDLYMVSLASAAGWFQVLERGCRIWLSPPPFDHSKLMLVDGGWALFGSSNWDQRSLRLNFEFNVECYDEDVVEKLSGLVQEKIKHARQVHLRDVEKLPTLIQLRNGIARLFSPHL
jgi:cardiolipin synthase